MAFNINDFKAHVNSRGLAKNNLFFATITPPTTLGFLQDRITSNELSFLCKTAQLPSLDFTTADFRPHGYGKVYKRPVEFTESSMQLVFMVDAQFGVLKFFHRWMQSIFNYNMSSVTEDPQGKLPYEFEYRDNYAAVIEVLVFSANDTGKVYRYKLTGAYPVTVGQVDVSWENQAEIMTLGVSFEYDNLQVDALELGSTNPNLSRANGLISYLSSINGIGQAIRSIDTPQSLQDLINQYTTVNTIFNSL